MKYLCAIACSFSSYLAIAQSDLSSLSDEFSDTASAGKWSFAHTAEGYDSKLRQMKIQSGALRLEPFASGWYADYQGPFLFQLVEGNFDVCMKIKVSGKNNELPDADWSLAGLMVRQPKNSTKETWRPRMENWLFLTTGIAHQPGLPVFETKSTNNSLSNLKLRPAKKGWVEMRIVRIDAAFILMARYENEKWQVLDRFYRPLMQGPLQVGITSYSGWEQIPADLRNNPKAFNETTASSPADLVVEIDYIRFKKPSPNMTLVQPKYNKEYNATLYYSAANLLTDYSITNEDLLKILGD